MKKTTDRLVLTALIAIGVMLVWKQSSVSPAVTEALKSCAYRIIPSLFAMTVISAAISRSGVIAELLCRTNLNPNIFTAFLFGNIGGYPIGAKLLSEMVDDGCLTPSEAERAMMFCYGSGPAFAAGVAGMAIFGDIRFGLAALMANFLANFTLYLGYMIFSKKHVIKMPIQRKGFSTGLMVESVNSAAGAMMGICSMIVFFAALKAVLESVLPQISNMKYFAGALEISNIAALSVRQGVSLVAVTILLGFGGLCVHMQLFAIINGRFRMSCFYLSRLIALPLAGVYAFVIERILYHFGIVSSAATKIRLSQSKSLIPIICIAAMVFITLREKPKAA